MPFCANCGAAVDGRFCPSCGRPVSGSPGGSPAASATPSAPPLADNIASALCYAVGLLTGVLFLVLEPYSRNRMVRFHAFQAIFFHLSFIAAFSCLYAGTQILRLIPFIGVLIAVMLYPLLSLAGMAVWIMLMYKAYNKEKWVLPFIGPLAENQAYSSN